MSPHVSQWFTLSRTAIDSRRFVISVLYSYKTSVVWDTYKRLWANNANLTRGTNKNSNKKLVALYLVWMKSIV